MCKVLLGFVNQLKHQCLFFCSSSPNRLRLFSPVSRWRRLCLPLSDDQRVKLIHSEWTYLWALRRSSCINIYWLPPPPFPGVCPVNRKWYLCIWKSNPITGLNRPWGFQEDEARRFQDSRQMKVVRLSALRTGRLHPFTPSPPPTPVNIPGTHFCWVRGGTVVKVLCYK